MRIIPGRAARRKVSIILIVLGVLVIIFLFAVNSPGASRIRTLKDKNNRLEEQTHLLVTVGLPDAQGKMSLASDLEILWDAFQNTHETLLRKIPIVPERGDFLNNICQIAKTDGIEIVSMKAGDIDVFQGFSTIPVTIEVNCRFQELGIFLKSIEKMERLTRLDRYDIRSDEAHKGSVVASLEIMGYIRPGK